MNENAKELIRIIHKTKRPLDTIYFLDKVLEQNPNLDYEFQVIYIQSYKALASSYRNGIRNTQEEIDEGLHKEAELISRLSTFKKKQVEELNQICNKGLKVVDQLILPKTEDFKTKALFLKLKGDLHRYICENEQPRNEKRISLIHETYKAALDLVSKDLPAFHQINLGIILNLCVLMFEIMNQKKEAIELAESTYENASKEFENQISNDEYYDSLPYLQILIDNVTLWKNMIQ